MPRKALDTSWRVLGCLCRGKTKIHPFGRIVAFRPYLPNNTRQERLVSSAPWNKLPFAVI